LGVKVVDRLLVERRHKQIRLEDLGRLTRRVKTLKPFVTAADWSPGGLTDRADLRSRLAPEPEQLRLF